METVSLRRTFGVPNRFPDILQTSSVIQIFILAMVLYPDVQARARAEIDQVVPHDRIPSIDDRTSLPYIDAVLCEVLRWNTPAPLGLSAVI
jgi:cytochrome P450